MAFSATIRNVQYLGPGRKSFSGEWAGLAGDAAGSMQFGGIVTQAYFQGYDADNFCQIIPRVSSSVASGITTLTINNQEPVTTGYFTVETLG